VEEKNAKHQGGDKESPAGYGDWRSFLDGYPRGNPGSAPEKSGQKKLYISCGACLRHLVNPCRERKGLGEIRKNPGSGVMNRGDYPMPKWVTYNQILNN